MDKEKKPFYKKWWIWLIAIIVIIFVFVMSQPATEEYKTDAIDVTWMQLADDEISGSTKVKVSGKVSNTGNETLILTDQDGVYYLKNEDASKTKLSENIKIEVWGVYSGKDSETGLPKIIAKLIEKK